MKRLLVLWDPGNPLTPIGPVMAALRRHAEIVELTFGEVSHRTLPNRAFEILPHIERTRIDGLLWVEGGPLPSDLDRVRCPKACWLPSPTFEPTLVEDLGPLFDRWLVPTLTLVADERARWLPLAASSALPPEPPQGISVLLDDPKPAAHAIVERKLEAALDGLSSPSHPIVFCQIARAY